jgi:cell division protein FtsB
MLHLFRLPAFDSMFSRMGRRLRLRLRLRLLAKDATRSPLKYVRLAFAGLILFYIMFGNYGFVTRVRLELQKMHLQAQLEAERLRTQSLQDEIQNMQRLEEIERWAREKYHLSAPGETIYVLKP